MSIVIVPEVGIAIQPEVTEVTEKAAPVDKTEAATTAVTAAPTTTPKGKVVSKKEKISTKKEKTVPKKPTAKKEKTKVVKEAATSILPKGSESTFLLNENPEQTSLAAKEADASSLATKETAVPVAFKEPATTPLTIEKNDTTPLTTQISITALLATKDSDNNPLETSQLENTAVEKTKVDEPKPKVLDAEGGQSEQSTTNVDNSTQKRERPSVNATEDPKTGNSDDLPKVKKSRGRPAGSVNKFIKEKKVIVQDGEKKGRGRPAGSVNKFKKEKVVVFENGEKRGRGRPAGSVNKFKKEKKIVLENGEKRGRGRPFGSLSKAKKENGVAPENGEKKARGRPKGSHNLKDENGNDLPKPQSRGKGRPKSSSGSLNADGTKKRGRPFNSVKYKKLFNNVIYEPTRDKHRCLAGRLRSFFLPLNELELSAESLINFSEWSSKYYESLEKKQQNFDEDVKTLIEMETKKFAQHQVALWDSDLVSLDKTLFGNDTDSKLDFSSGLSTMDLRLILDWKFMREKKVIGIFKLLNSNTEIAVKKAIKIVYNSLKEKLVLNQDKGPLQFIADFKQDIGSWMIHLTGLNGITVPTASAILAAMTPYIPYMSFEGLSASLGQESNRIALDAYNSYIDYVYSILKKSDSVDLTPKAVERAWYAKAILSPASE